MQPQQFLVFENPAQYLFQDAVGDGLKIMVNIAFQGIQRSPVIAHVPNPSGDRGGSEGHPAPLPAGAAIIKEPFVKKRFNHIAYGVLHHPVHKGQRGNYALLRLMDFEHPIGALPVAVPDQVILDVDKIFFLVRRESQHFIPVSLALPG